MVGSELLVLEVDPVERNGADLIVPDAQPRPAAAHQEPVHAGGMNQGNNRGVFDQAQAAALQVINLEAQQFGEKKKFVRHRESPEPIKYDPWSARTLVKAVFGCALHGLSVLLWRKGNGGRNKKGEKNAGLGLGPYAFRRSRETAAVLALQKMACETSRASNGRRLLWPQTSMPITRSVNAGSPRVTAELRTGRRCLWRSRAIPNESSPRW